jgi:hypothetical protein
MPPRDVANRPANSNIGLPVNWIAADVVRLKDGILIECSDAIQDEAAEQQSKGGNPMFGHSFRSKYERNVMNGRISAAAFRPTSSPPYRLRSLLPREGI